MRCDGFVRSSYLKANHSATDAMIFIIHSPAPVPAAEHTAKASRSHTHTPYKTRKFAAHINLINRIPGNKNPLSSIDFTRFGHNFWLAAAAIYMHILLDVVRFSHRIATQRNTDGNTKSIVTLFLLLWHTPSLTNVVVVDNDNDDDGRQASAICCHRLYICI